MKRAHPLVLVTVLFGLLLLAWSATQDPLSAPDELFHYDAVHDVREGRGWPPPGSAESRLEVARHFPSVQFAAPPRNYMTQHPPLYYALAAPFAVRPADARHVYYARLAGVLMLLPLPALAWATAGRLGGSGPVAALVPLAVPQLLHVGAAVNNDALLVVTGAALTWLAVRARTGDSSWRTAAGGGLVLAAALLTKGLALALVPVAVAGWWGSWRRLPVVLGLGLLGGWWWVLNLVRYGVVQPAGYDERAAGPGWGAVRYARFFAEQMAVRFWGSFELLSRPLPRWLVALASVGLLAALVLGARRLRSLAVVPLLPVAGLLAVVAWGAVRANQTTGGTPGVQGRYLFAGLAGLAAVAAVGLRRVPPAWLLVPVAVLQAYAAMVAFDGLGSDGPYPGWLYATVLAVVPVAAVLLAVRLAADSIGRPCASSSSAATT